MVVIGGNGSQSGSNRCRSRFPVVGVASTIIMTCSEDVT